VGRSRRSVQQAYSAPQIATVAEALKDLEVKLYRLRRDIEDADLEDDWQTRLSALSSEHAKTGDQG
jgi:hypothetical protein